MRNERAGCALGAEAWEAVVADLAEQHADELEARIVRLRALAAELRV